MMFFVVPLNCSTPPATGDAHKQAPGFQFSSYTGSPRAFKADVA
jgi:hypothetical protein